jgi:hypothetical protein
LPIGSLMLSASLLIRGSNLAFLIFSGQESSCGTTTQGLRCRGLGKSVQGRVAFRGQSAAHDQITERKLSVSRFRTSFSRV